MANPKILVPDIADRASFALDDEGAYAFTSGYGITLTDDTGLTLPALLALLNSHALNFYVQQVSTELRGGFFRYFTQFIEQLPLPVFEADAAERLAALAREIEEAQTQVEKVRSDRQKSVYQRRLRSKERALNALCYKLYGLGEEEQRVVRETLAR